MFRYRLTPYATLAALALAAGTGCPRRTEIVTVTPRGGVSIDFEFEGTAEELARVAALPSEAGGWDISHFTKTEDDEEIHVWSAKRFFAPDEALPVNYAPPGDPDADLALQQPTTVRMETRSDGIYFYFHRVYSPRKWSYIKYWQESLVDEPHRELIKKPTEALTPGERRTLMEAFAGVEAYTQVEFARDALAEIDADLPVEYRLLARQALLTVYSEDVDWEAVADRCGTGPEDVQVACFDREAQRIMHEAHAAYVRALVDHAGYGDLAIARFEDAYDRAERRYEITNDLGNEQMRIDLLMPGTLVAHNGCGEEQYEELDACSVTWEFDGKAFRDRPHELWAVSRWDLDADPDQWEALDALHK